MLRTSNILVTGGAGTLGRAIAERRRREGWTGKLTVYSTDDHKHQLMRRFYPDIQYVQGDIRNPDTLYNAMCGHEVVIHAAAVKVIPTSEYWSIDTFDVNVNGSLNVCIQAMRANVKHVLGISTDKACHPANAYGCTKMMMEKAFQEFSRTETETHFHLVRYGNVLESNGSVIEAWHKAIERGEKIKVTDPNMTRFWLSPQQAVDLVILAMKLESGLILIPKMPSLSIGRLAEYTACDQKDWQRIPMRPGEKMHEELLTIEETEYAVESNDFFFLRPSTAEKVANPPDPFSSDVAQELTEQELGVLLDG